ncbi:MAG: DUF2807 domain-containing protein [Candidatus Peribacteraceae bacterium]|nr:DUF2807 domain-containing protein [Candidatus Peribacteraceae bacterium]
MHKTVTITIGGLLFHVEDDAFERLDRYLASVRAHFSSYADADEIVSDIENRIAEEFAEITKGRKKAVTAKDVEALTARMGTVEDFKRFGGEEVPGREEPKENVEDRRKEPLFRGRLYRDTDDRVLGGVCAGIANYAGIDPVIVRLLFALTIFFGGAGVILYIILWIIVPEAKTTTEKMEMKQQRVTLSAIQERVKEKMPPEKTRNALRQILTVPFVIIRRVLEVLGRFLRAFFPLIARAVGFLMILGVALAIAGLTTYAVLLVTDPATALVDLPLQEITGRATYLTLVGAGYFIAFLPLVFVLMVGASLLSMKSAFSPLSLAVLVGLWGSAVATLGVTAVTHAPVIEAAFERIRSERVDTVSRAFTFRDFTGVQADGFSTLTIRRGDAYEVSLEASPLDQEQSSLQVVDGMLTLDHDRGIVDCLFFCSRRSVTLAVTMPRLQTVRLTGASQGEVQGFRGGTMTFGLSGASMLNADVRPDALDADVSGSSQLYLAGEAKTLTFNVSGASWLDALSFMTGRADADVSGASTARVYAVESLTGEASGASRILYRVLPKQLDVDTSGASAVEKVSEEELR